MSSGRFAEVCENNFFFRLVSLLTVDLLCSRGQVRAKMVKILSFFFKERSKMSPSVRDYFDDLLIRAGKLVLKPVLE